MKTLLRIFKNRLFIIILFLPLVGSGEVSFLSIGSKKFNESYILAEIMAQLLESEGFKVNRSLGLGGTLVAFEALQRGEIDVYPEYTGTIAQVLIKDPSLTSQEELMKGLKPIRIELGSPFGFNNTYVLAALPETIKKFKVSNVSQLKGLKLKAVFPYEFLQREDGWRRLKKLYQLNAIEARGMDHGLTYEAISRKQADIMVAYSTDAKVKKFNIHFLKDDKNFFPNYLALPLYRKDFPEKARLILSRLSNLISDAKMRELNSEVQLNGKSFAQVAQTFLLEQGLVEKKKSVAGRMDLRMLGKRVLQHLLITFTAIIMAGIVAIPLGIALQKTPVLASYVVSFSGLLQTIPSIALLAFMIPFFGIGVLPAVMGLFLYSILPILRNTYVALAHIEGHYLEAARGIGLTFWESLRSVQLPMGLPIIIAGVRTAAVINIGTATLAAFIGAGGLGEPIVTGLALNDTKLILQGAIPAALLAILVEVFFAQVEKRVSWN